MSKKSILFELAREEGQGHLGHVLALHAHDLGGVLDEGGLGGGGGVEGSRVEAKDAGGEGVHGELAVQLLRQTVPLRCS